VYPHFRHWRHKQQSHTIALDFIRKAPLVITWLLLWRCIRFFLGRAPGFLAPWHRRRHTSSQPEQHAASDIEYVLRASSSSLPKSWLTAENIQDGKRIVRTKSFIRQNMRRSNRIGFSRFTARLARCR
jgi:hypothetical protein